MTNTRITGNYFLINQDVEILEKRYPVRLIEFSIRKGSGKKFIYSGGKGNI
jgi:N-methylhydantoinase B/oxoprolinase/acetone carboxylase alpha subunit